MAEKLRPEFYKELAEGKSEHGSPLKRDLPPTEHDEEERQLIGEVFGDDYVEFLSSLD